MPMTLAEEKLTLERMRKALTASGEAGVTCAELQAAADVTLAQCRRLLFLLVGQRFITRVYEPRSTKKNGVPQWAFVYRVRK